MLKYIMPISFELGGYLQQIQDSAVLTFQVRKFDHSRNSTVVYRYDCVLFFQNEMGNF